MAIILNSKGKRGNVGDVRWVVTWWNRRTDPDDIDTAAEMFDVFPNAKKAIEFAGKKCESPDLEWGICQVQEQRLEWFVQEDDVVSWEDHGAMIEIAPDDHN